MGTECIIPGTDYQYDLYGKWDAQSEVKVCVEGGSITVNNAACYSSKGFRYVRVMWKKDITTGSISITSSLGTGSLVIKPTRQLEGGKIDSLFRIQAIQLLEIPRVIHCSPAIGGSCNPSFLYQWEQSNDGLHWSGIKEAVFQDLAFSVIPDRTVFVRRKIIESTSSSIAYSDIAVIAVPGQFRTN